MSLANLALQLTAQLAQQDAPRIAAQQGAERIALKTHVFPEGFDDIVSGGTLHHRASVEVRNWVASVPRTQSGTRFDYIADTTQLKIGPTALARIRGLDPKVHAQDGPAVDQLIKRVKPSVKAAGVDWVAALALVFAITLTPEESETLVDLITFRNLYIHDPPAAFAMTITGEHIKCWTVAAMVLSQRLALA